MQIAPAKMPHFPFRFGFFAKIHPKFKKSFVYPLVKMPFLVYNMR